MSELDRTQQRIVGALLEKELSVPESYPLTENALVAACNQKSNRDPEMGLEPFEVRGALSALMSANWARTTRTAGSRTERYAHRLSSHHECSPAEKAILCEFLVRGPQAPGALKGRVARLGFLADSPEAIEAVLRKMAARGIPLVEELPRRARERDERWRHLLGPIDPVHVAAAEEGAGSGAPTARPTGPGGGRVGDSELERRVGILEAAIEELRAEVEALRGR